MEPQFCWLGATFKDIIQIAAPARPDAGLAIVKTSEWAEKLLNFVPSAKQAEVMDSDARYLIPCCNRQWCAFRRRRSLIPI